MDDVQTDPVGESGELHEAHSEIRHLKNTIGALREELESTRYANEQDVQSAIAITNDEIVQLRATAQALRDELENLRFEKDKAVQEAVANANDEIVQLRKTAQTLRDELRIWNFSDEHIETLLDGLRKAGLPEAPPGEPTAED